MRLGAHDLAARLRSIAALVEAGDSFDGSLSYELMGPDEFEFSAAYRFGNSNGQGSVQIVPVTERSAKP